MAHEVAHQWWGNVVIPKSYQDEWLPEALAHYSALLWLEKKKGSNALEDVMADFQADLLKPGEDGQTVESAGPISWGYRLRSVSNPRKRSAPSPTKRAPGFCTCCECGWGRNVFSRSWPSCASQYQFRAGGHGGLARTGEEIASYRVSLPIRWTRSSITGCTPPASRRCELKYSVKGKAPSWKISGTVEQSSVDDNFSVDIPVQIQFAKGAPQTVWVQNFE